MRRLADQVLPRKDLKQEPIRRDSKRGGPPISLAHSTTPGAVGAKLIRQNPSQSRGPQILSLQHGIEVGSVRQIHLFVEGARKASVGPGPQGNLVTLRQSEGGRPRTASVIGRPVIRLK